MKKYILILLVLTPFLSFSQNIPSGYYDETNGLTGEELKHALHKIIRGHKVYTYGDFRDTILPTLDEDPDNSDNIILFYKNASIPKANFASNNQQDFWNREHTWAKSHGFPDESDTAYTDVHNLRPSDASVNTSKSNKDFNDVENIADNAQGEAPDTYTNSDFWDPRDEIKGDVARILFYMATRYDSKRLDLELVDRISRSEPEFGVLYTLIKWHEQDPVDQYEIDRHEGAYGFQENRNPFVDHPEWVADIWGSASAPLILLNTDNFNPDFGNVEIGQSLTQSYIINAYNLTSDVTVSVSAPFFVSENGSDFSNSITFTNGGDDKQNFTVFLKYEPATEDAATTVDLVHATTGFETTIEVSGKEGANKLLTIAEARELALGEVVKVTGVVINTGNNNQDNKTIYDGTAGIVLRSFDDNNIENTTEFLEQGDSVVVTGPLVDYNSLLEIEGSPITIDVISKENALPEPQVVKISEIGENLESELVTIEDVTFNDAGGTFAYGNFDISDDTGTLILRIGNGEHPLVGQPIPSGTFDLTGFIGQYQSDYQLFLNDASGIQEAGEPVEEVDLITIAEARALELGEVVRVKGIVLGGENNNTFNRVVFDGTAGIVVRNTDGLNLSSTLVAGDSVEVRGGLTDYNGLLEIEDAPVSIILINSENTLPEAELIEVADISEGFESELITIENISFVENGTFEVGTYTITDGTNSVDFKIGLPSNSLVGTTIPTGSFNLLGLVGESNDGYYIYSSGVDAFSNVDNQPLAVSGYQLSKNVIYPNPSKNTIYINLDGESSKSIDKMLIYSVDGQLQKHIPNINAHEGVDISSLEAGLYTVILTAVDQNFVYKLVKK